MGIEHRGFASMDRSRQRQIASQGGKAAHRAGRAHEWTREEAQLAGSKGGVASHARRRAATVAARGADVSAKREDDGGSLR